MVDEVRQVLVDDPSITSRSRDLVMEIIHRLADQVRAAEISRDVVVRELVTLQERLKVIFQSWGKVLTVDNSATRFGDLVHCGQLFKACGNNLFHFSSEIIFGQLL